MVTSIAESFWPRTIGWKIGVGVFVGLGTTVLAGLVDIFKVGVDATVAGIGVSVGSGVSVGRWDSVGYGV